MNRRNYQRELEEIIAGIDRRAEERIPVSQGKAEDAEEASGYVPKLLLHACCAPCSSYCLEYLAPWFGITVFYYNPNIDDPAEYRKRVLEEQRLIRELPSAHPVHILEGAYDPERFHSLVRGHEQDPEGGARCAICFRERLEVSARTAAEQGFDWFTTTLTISPLKNAPLLNELGEAAGRKYGVRFLPSDFKKKNGYRRSVELSRDYGLYRQNYCGCSFSKAEAARREHETIRIRSL